MKARRSRTLPKCRACGKLVHKTNAAAVSWILKVTGDGAPPLRTYRCAGNPKVWHVTSKK